MGHSSKKKKRGGGGRLKGRAPSKDHNSHGRDDNDLISEEITALCAIFQDDCKVISDSPPLININLSPYSKDAGYDDLEVSALLSVRCLPGYPYKCPKLQISMEKGLSKADAENLLSLLNDQANSNAREGRVMIYNLVEAAQEFLSEIVPVGQPYKSVPYRETERSNQLSLKDAAESCNKSCSSRGPFVYGFIDLFSVSGESWHWGLEMEENHGMNPSVQSQTVDRSKQGYDVPEHKIDHKVKPTVVQEVKQVSIVVPVKKLDTLEEEYEDNSKSLSSSDLSRSLSGESVGTGATKEAKDLLLDHPEDSVDGYIDSDPSESVSSGNGISVQLSQTSERDLMLAHLLRLACASKEQLADALPEITSELYKLGIISERVQDLATKPSSFFDQTFDDVFGQKMVTSKNSQFWKIAADFGGQKSSPTASSRYLNDFEELQPLGAFLEAKRKHLYWTPCAAHCLDLMLEDIAGIGMINRTMARAITLTGYIYNHTGVLNMMRQFTGQRELLRPAKTRFATLFLTLASLHRSNENLRKMFVSDEWGNSRWARESKGKKVKEIVLMPSFWTSILFAIKVSGPLVRVLRLVDGEKKPPMGYIYEAMDRAKECIATSFNGKEDKYSGVYAIIDRRWESQLHRPLHAAAHLLNPEFFYSDATIQENEEIVDGFLRCMQRLVRSPDIQEKIDFELSKYRNAEGLFGNPMTIRMRSKKAPGHGGFGHVVLCKNKLDGRQYAVKKIRLKDKGPPVNDRILREVATLSRLQHQHVVRYYQAWYEMGFAGSYADATWSSMTAVSSSLSNKGVTSADNENKVESTYLYIQMEYCPRTVRQMFESYNRFDKELAWHLSRQIVEGLAHIHGQGIIHRDLTPSNIFFDARNDIKIGDFGLAKFLKLEQLDQEPDPAETVGVSVDRTGQVGTYFYTAPEIEQGWPKIDEKADMYSLGIVFFELWHPFGTAMERHIVLSDLKQKGELPAAWVAEFPEQAALLRWLMSSSPSDRPSATELLEHAFPPRMEYELLDNILRTMHTSEDTSVYDKVVTAVFSEDLLSANDPGEHGGRLGPTGNNTSSIQYTDFDTEVRDQVTEVTMEVFRQHCAKHLEIIPMRLLGDCPPINRNAVKLLTHGGDMIELCHELRLPFVKWVIANQKAFFKRYEISYVYRRAIGHSPPNRYLQGDLDIIGGASALTEAEALKATMSIINRFFNSESCDIHLNHGDLLDAIWSWIGIKVEHRRKVAEILSLLGTLRPQSSERKSKWVVIRRQLRQELNLAEAAVNRLQTVGLRFCGVADQALPRLRGALPAEKLTRKALDELSALFSYLRVWKIEKHVFIDALMPPAESYHRDLFFQIYVRKANNPVSLTEGTLLAIGGRYDYLLYQLWPRDYKSNPPGAVGVSIALETIIQRCFVDIRPLRYDVSSNVLICSRGRGGLLEERMQLVAELWEENIKAEFVPVSDPSLTEQYEYANEHDIKCLIIVTDTQTGSVKVRHLELKKEKEVDRENLVKFLLEAMATQFKNPSIWS